MDEDDLLGRFITLNGAFLGVMVRLKNQTESTRTLNRGTRCSKCKRKKKKKRTGRNNYLMSLMLQ